MAYMENHFHFLMISSIFLQKTELMTIQEAISGMMQGNMNMKTRLIWDRMQASLRCSLMIFYAHSKTQ